MSLRLPIVGPDVRAWANDMRRFLGRQWDRLSYKAEGVAADEDGIMLWDAENGYPVVSKDGAYETVTIGVTATAAELNQLDGVVLGTGAEANSISQVDLNAGTDTTEGTITAAKLAGVIANSREKSGTPVATTSGTLIDFTSIPAEVQEIDVLFNGVSLSGSESVLVQIGTSGGIVRTGYDSACSSLTASTVSIATSLTSFLINIDGAGRAFSGLMKINRLAPGSNTWVASVSGGAIGNSTNNGGGAVTLSAELDRVRIRRTSVDTFDAGSVNVRWK